MRSCLIRCPSPDANYTSGDDYVVEFLGYRFSFDAADFEGRVVAAAVKLGVVETTELDEEEIADLVALAAQGVIDEPASRLGRYLVRNWERVSLVERRVARLLAAQADLPRRLARPPGEARRARGRLGRRATPSSPTSTRAAAAGRCSSSRRCRRGTSCSSGRSGRRPARRTSPRCSRSTTYATLPGAARARRAHVASCSSRRALTRVPLERRAQALGVVVLRDDRRGDRLADLGRLPLPAAQPAALRPAGARARLPDRARRSRSRSERTRASLVVTAAAVAADWGLLGLTVLPRRDVAGAIGVPLLLLFLWRGRNRAIYAGVFLVVASLELYGTAIGTWRWARELPGPRHPGRQSAERRRVRLRVVRRDGAARRAVPHRARPPIAAMRPMSLALGAVSQGRHEASPHLRRHQEREHRGRAGRAARQADRRVRRPLHPHGALRPRPSRHPRRHRFLSGKSRRR